METPTVDTAAAGPEASDGSPSLIWSELTGKDDLPDVAVLADRARAQRKSGDLDGAQATLDIGLERFPTDRILGWQAAQLATLRKDWATARDRWTRYVDAPGRPSPRAILMLAQACTEDGRPDLAGKAIRSGYKAWPRDPAILAAATALAASQNDSKELQTLRKSAEKSVKKIATPREYLRRVGALIRTGDLEGADRTVANGLRRYPLDAGLLNKAAEVEIARRRAADWTRTSSAQPLPSCRVRTICGVFWLIERELALLDWRLHGVAVWPLIRMQLYYAITRQVGVYDHPHPGMKGGIKTPTVDDAHADAGRIDGLDEDGFTLRTARGQVRRKIPRRALLMATKKINGTEPYSDALRTELGKDVILLERSFGEPPIAGALDFGKMRTLFRERHADPSWSYMGVDDRLLCDRIETRFRLLLGVEIGDLPRLCLRIVAEYASVKAGFSLFFKANPVDVLYLTNAYQASTRAALAAARDHGAHIVELQHGFISEFHLGYSWPGRPHVPDTADELWTFGQFWSDATPLAGGAEARVIGAPYVSRLAAAATGQHDPDLVVFTSQGVIGKRLFPMALETARRLPDKKIVFRLHPNEDLEDFEALVPVDAPANFALSHRDPNIFSLLAHAAVQVGAFSTTLFEGMALGTRTVVLDLPGIEYMGPAIVGGDVLFAADVDDLVANLQFAPLPRDACYYYAKPLDRLVSPA